jgi:hypothetical protein
LITNAPPTEPTKSFPKYCRSSCTRKRTNYLRRVQSVMHRHALTKLVKRKTLICNWWSINKFCNDNNSHNIANRLEDVGHMHTFSKASIQEEEHDVSKLNQNKHVSRQLNMHLRL